MHRMQFCSSERSLVFSWRWVIRFAVEIGKICRIELWSMELLRRRLKPIVALCQRIRGACVGSGKRLCVSNREGGRGGGTNKKGRDFGYALTVSSCEGANS